MDDLTLYVEVEVKPTESEERVRRAVENVLGNIPLELRVQAKGNLLTGEARGVEFLTKLYNLLRRERIRDAARGALFEGLSQNTIVIYLNKQVAFAGHVSFSKAVAESPLGPIMVRIECSEPRKLIDWLAPKTT